MSGDNTSVDYHEVKKIVGNNLQDIQSKTVKLYEKIIDEQVEKQVDNVLSSLINDANHLVIDLKDLLKIAEGDLNILLNDTERKLNQ